MLYQEWKDVVLARTPRGGVCPPVSCKDPTHRSSKTLAGFTIGVQLTDHNVGRMRDDGAENTCKISTSESNTGLSALGIVGLLAGQASIHHLHNRFERGKLHHCVGNLSSPQWVQPFVEPGVILPANTLRANNLADTIPGTFCKGRHRGLHADLDSLEGTEANVSEELGGSGASQIDPGLVSNGVLGTGKVRVELLEELIASVLQRALDTVAEECWRSTGLTVHLTAAFHEIKRRHTPVSCATCHEPTEGACRIVFGTVQLNLANVRLRSFRCLAEFFRCCIAELLPPYEQDKVSASRTQVAARFAAMGTVQHDRK
ncbi:hypothetical protein KC323_g123 [Hortaea werneckii]|nr:hypothetical protein KC323_g123 [Hortaea werneckii]